MIDCVIITGPTATGKTKIAVNLARRFNGEIISCDSRQVYRGFNLGSGKDLCDYEENIEGRAVKYHLIDITTLNNRFNVWQWEQHFNKAFCDIKTRENLPIICGGTGLYIDSIVRGYKFTGPNGKEIIGGKINPLIIGVTMERSELRKNIKKRLIERLNAGMINEIESLISEYGRERVESLGLEARYCSLYLNDNLGCGNCNKSIKVCHTCNITNLIDVLSAKIGQFAKRQETWFRFMEKNGVKINWLNKNASVEEKIREAIGLIQKNI